MKRDKDSDLHKDIQQTLRDHLQGLVPIAEEITGIETVLIRQMLHEDQATTDVENQDTKYVIVGNQIHEHA